MGPGLSASRPRVRLSIPFFRGVIVRRFTLADVLLFTTICIWGLNVTVVKLLLHSFQPLGLSVARFIIVTSVFAVLVPATEGSPAVKPRHLPLLVLAGLTGIWLNQVAFTYGLQRTTAANMTLLMATIPIFVGLGALGLGWERPGWRHWTGIAIGFGGVAMVVLGAPHQGSLSSGLLGDLLALLTAASWATYSLLLRPLMQLYSAPRISLYVVAVGLLVLLPLGVPQLAGMRASVFTGHIWVLLIYSSVGSVVLTNIFWYTGIHQLGPARATVYSYFQPFAGLVFAVGILREPISLPQVIGGGTILAGIIFGREPKPEIALTE